MRSLLTTAALALLVAPPAAAETPSVTWALTYSQAGSVFAPGAYRDQAQCAAAVRYARPLVSRRWHVECLPVLQPASTGAPR